MFVYIDIFLNQQMHVYQEYKKYTNAKQCNVEGLMLRIRLHTLQNRGFVDEYHVQD